MKLIDLESQYLKIKRELDRAFLETLKSGQFILHNRVEKFEKRISKLTGTPYAIGLNSGTDALFLALKALNIKEGDEVITTPFSFISTAETIAQCGARPVFVDINPETFNIDAGKIERAVTKKTRAIMPVHLYGQMADMEKIMKIARKHKLRVTEDAAQAIGAKQKIKERWRVAGSVGDIGCFSFFPTKNLGATGDGGIAVTKNKKIADKIRLLRNHGAKKKYFHEILGYSSRLDELQAAILLVKIKFLKNWSKKRRSIANFYTKELACLPQVKTPAIAKGNSHIFHQYTLRTEKRDKLRGYLRKKNIPTAIHYPFPLYLQPVFKYLSYKRGDFPAAEQAAREVISLPIYPELTLREQKRVVSEIKKFFK